MEKSNNLNLCLCSKGYHQWSDWEMGVDVSVEQSVRRENIDDDVITEMVSKNRKYRICTVCGNVEYLII